MLLYTEPSRNNKSDEMLLAVKKGKMQNIPKANKGIMPVIQNLKIPLFPPLARYNDVKRSAMDSKK